MLARIAVTLGAALGVASLAGGAAAASLSVTVSPTTVHPRHRYTVSITGRAHPRHRTPYLLAFIQYSGRACRSTATAEYALPASTWSWAVFPRPEAKSPFKRVTYWKASTRLGARRICAYLYAGPVSPATTVGPLVRAGAAYRVKRG